MIFSVSFPLTPKGQIVASWVAAYGPFLFHRALDVEAIEPILSAEGLVPGDSGWHGFWEPRPGHNYASTLARVDDYQGIPLAIDLRQIDVETLVADEDWFQEGVADGFPHDGLTSMGCESDWVEGMPTQGDWASENAAILDSPAALAYSLNKGSVAFRGGVPAQALSLATELLSGTDIEELKGCPAAEPYLAALLASV